MLNMDRVFESTWTTRDNAGDNPVTPTTPFMDFQTDNGVVIPDTASCKEIAISAYKEAFGYDIDTTPDTHVGRMIEQTAKIFRSCLGITAANVMQTDLNSATGRYLDALASLFFESRNSGTHTVCTASVELVSTPNPTVSFVAAYNANVLARARVLARSRNAFLGEANDENDESGESGETEVEAGSMYFVDGNGKKFILSEDVYLSSSETAKVAKFVCEEVGAVVPNETGISWKVPTGIKTPTGIIQVVSLGYDVESDDAFRTRLKSTRPSSVNFMESIYSALFDIDGVFDAKVVENTTSEAAPKGDFTSVPGHSIAVVVDYDGSTATATRIAKALYERKSVGCGYTQNLSVTVTSGGSSSTVPLTCVSTNVTDPYFLTKYTVYFHKPNRVGTAVAVTVARHNYSGTDLETLVKQTVRAWASGNVPFVDGLKIGQDVKAFEIGAAISAKIPDIQVNGVVVGKYEDRESLSATTLAIADGQVAYIPTAADAVSVQIV